LKLAAPRGVSSSISSYKAVTILRVNELERECGPTYGCHRYNTSADKEPGVFNGKDLWPDTCPTVRNSVELWAGCYPVLQSTVVEREFGRDDIKLDTASFFRLLKQCSW